MTLTFNQYFYIEFSGFWVTGLNLRVIYSVGVITGCGPKMGFILQTPQNCLVLNKFLQHIFCMYGFKQIHLSTLPRSLLLVIFYPHAIRHSFMLVFLIRNIGGNIIFCLWGRYQQDLRSFWGLAEVHCISVLISQFFLDYCTRTCCLQWFESM